MSASLIQSENFLFFFISYQWIRSLVDVIWHCSMEAIEANPIVSVEELFIQYPSLRNTIQLHHWDLNTACSRAKSNSLVQKVKQKLFNCSYKCTLVRCHGVPGSPTWVWQMQQMFYNKDPHSLGAEIGGYTRYPTNSKLARDFYM